ncbi:putative reverse transcriptase domain-containing protein [Tanacetum coccineum]
MNLLTTSMTLKHGVLYYLIHELLNEVWFLESKGSGGRRGVKEKNKDVVARDGVSPSVSDEIVVKEKQSSLVNTSVHIVKNTDLRSKALNFCTLYTPRGKYGLVKSMLKSSTGLFSFQFISMDCLNAMLENGPWFIRNHPLILKKWNPNVKLLKEDVGNVPVWVKLHSVPITTFSEDGLSAIAMKHGTSLMLDSYTSDMCLQSWGRSSYARAIIELQADVESKDTIVEECPKNPSLGVAKNLKKPSQAPRDVPVGQKVGFKPTKEYRPVSKKPTVNTGGTKKKGVEPIKENVEISSTSTTPIVDKIKKLEKLIIEGKVTLVDDDGKPLKKVDYAGDHDSEDEVESVDNDMARSMASERVGFGTKSLLE